VRRAAKAQGVLDKIGREHHPGFLNLSNDVILESK
jgi:hypothetical protein